MNKEYYWEYMQECDKLIAKFLRAAKAINGHSLSIDGINLEKAIANFLWQQISHSEGRNLYTKKRLVDSNYNEVIENIWYSTLKPLLPPFGFNNDKNMNNSKYASSGLDIEVILSSYHDSILFFCLNNRQLKYFIPILKAINLKVVIITMSQLDETLLQKDNIEIIEFDIITQCFLTEQEYLRDKFTYLYFLTNTFYFLIRNIMPANMIMLEGCHYHTEIISAIGKNFSIKTTCIQQGWPSLFQTRFMNMTYDYFLTWGKAFNDLWSKHNTVPHFIEVGYPFEVINETIQNKTGIAFFFQSPSFIISQETFQQMIDFAFFCAEQFPDRQILIKEHPEYTISNKIKDEILSKANMQIVTEEAISTVFSKSEISVSIFSSTLMESIIHNTIPFIFNLTSNPSYYPDLQKDGLGIEVKTYEDAKEKIVLLMKNRSYGNRLKLDILEKQKKYFETRGQQCIEKILNVIYNV